MQKKRIHQDVYIGFGCLALCGLILALNTNIPPDAALMPRLLDGMLAILSLLIIYQGLRKSKLPVEEQGKGITWDDIKIPVITWGLVAIYGGLFYLVGYFVATAIMIPVIMRFMKQTSWKAIIIIDAVYLLAVYGSFVRMLSVNIDNFGLLGQLL